MIKIMPNFLKTKTRFINIANRLAQTNIDPSFGADASNFDGPSVKILHLCNRKRNKLSNNVRLILSLGQKTFSRL